jgi:hypothetical protein
LSSVIIWEIFVKVAKGLKKVKNPDVDKLIARDASELYVATGEENKQPSQSGSYFALFFALPSFTGDLRLVFSFMSLASLEVAMLLARTGVGV